jgi:hypothetical protein
MRPKKRDAWLALFVVGALVAAMWFLIGCTVKGFQYLPDGLATPAAMRAASVTARAEADALDNLADQADATTQRAFAFLAESAEAIGAPAVLGTLLGAGAGFLVPSPGQRKREKLLEEAAKK